MHPQKPPRSSLLILAAATLGLAACGDDRSGTDSKGGSSGGSLTTTAATQTDSTDTATAGTGNSATDSAGSDGATDSATSNPTTSPTTTATTSATTTATSDDTTMGAVSTGTTAEASSSTGPLGPVCGNGLLEEGEDCDDGNAAPLDACSNECTKVPCDQQEGNPGDLLSYIWIANSGQGTVSKIETKTGIEVGRYQVQGGNPSRTSVNLLGDVAVSSRDPGGVTKIAARLDSCIDKNNDGAITTSNGPNNVLPLGQD